jgi:hypothetical protein
MNLSMCQNKLDDRIGKYAQCFVFDVSHSKAGEIGDPRTSADARQSDPYQHPCADKDSIRDTIRAMRYDITFRQIELLLIIFVSSK